MRRTRARRRRGRPAAGASAAPPGSGRRTGSGTGSREACAISAPPSSAARSSGSRCGLSPLRGHLRSCRGARGAPTSRSSKHAPSYAPAIRFAVVHHTAGTNDYSPAQAAAILRGIELYHVKSNGWNDIGYNFLVDRYGTVYEGRAGGVDRNVIGAHALGFNTGSVGVAVMGTFTSARGAGGSRDVAREASRLAARSRARRSALEAVRHLGRERAVRLRDGGSAAGRLGPPRYGAHHLSRRSAVRADPTRSRRRRRRLGLPKLYEPRVTGGIGGARALPGTRLERASMDGDGVSDGAGQAARRRERAGADGRLDVGLDLGGCVRASRAPAGASTSPAPRPRPGTLGKNVVVTPPAGPLAITELGAEPGHDQPQRRRRRRHLDRSPTRRTPPRR